ncbi:MAG: hypothetical protein MI864_21260 [Pseudomonadales bacterium]|nr:hypothetical protein [Pseudomonadales bacterium]
MSVIHLYEEFRIKFPAIAEKSDSRHIKIWGNLDPEFAYSWFESLANTLNNEMSRGVPASKYAGIFRFILTQFQSGDAEVRKCIDVAFTENLFYQIEVEKIKPYWQILPKELKNLYVNFHGQEPIT